MKRLELYQMLASGQWVWKIVSIKGKVRKVLAQSGTTYTTKPNAKRAYENLWEYYHGAPKAL